MDCFGRITQLSQDYDTHGILVTLSVTEVSAQELQALKGMGELSINLKRWRKKRSLDANAYAWVLMSKMASVLGTSKDEVYEELLQKYGIIYEDEKGYITITAKNSVDISKITGHWKRYKDNGKFISYLMIKGSSKYDTAEMSQFIDRVVEEAKDLEIETLPPDEIARMKQEWGV